VIIEKRKKINRFVIAFVVVLIAGFTFPANSAELYMVAADDDEGTERPPISIQLGEYLEREKEKRESGTNEWGGFGGPMIQYLTLDLSALDPMTDDRGLDNLDESILLIGASGGMIHNNFRFGGFGMGGYVDEEDMIGLDRRKASISIGGGGLFFETHHYLNDQAGLLAGFLLGAGNISLEAKGEDMGPDEKWEVDESFLLFAPYVGAWYAPIEWMWIELDAGYQVFDIDTSGSDFDNDLAVEMVDGDLSGGFQAGLKINFGWYPKP
jgi:hypothetical protein